MKGKDMKSRSSIFIIAMIFFFIKYSSSQIPGYKNIEIVESVPVETQLDNPEIRNTFEVWKELIQNAEYTIDLEQFYISNEPGEPLEDIINLLIDASKRGVKIRIIADAGMYKTYPQTLDLLKTTPNFQVRLIDYRKILGGIQHAKYMIIDNQSVFIGSQNFDWRALKHIFELGLKIKNEQLAKVFTDIFEVDWALSESEKITVKPKNYDVPITIIENRDTIKLIPTFSPYSLIPDTNLFDEKNILDLINKAKNEIYFHVLTYSPVNSNKEYYAAIDNALRSAALRGVKINIMISDWSKRKPTIYYLKSLAVIPNITVKMTTVPEYSKGFIPYARVDHRKFLIVDNNYIWLGTSNWEKSYFYKSRNLGVIIENEKLNETFKNIFLKSWNGPYSYEIKPEIDYTPPKVGE